MLIGHHLNIKLNRDLQIWAPRNVIRNSWSILENNRLLRRPDLENGRPRTVSDHYHSFNLIMHSILNRQVPRWVSISLVRKGGLEFLQAHLAIPGKQVLVHLYAGFWCMSLHISFLYSKRERLSCRMSDASIWCLKHFDQMFSIYDFKMYKIKALRVSL